MRQDGVVCDYDFRKLSADDVESGAKSLIDRLRSALDKIGAVQPDDAGFENCVQVRKFLRSVLHLI
jgi:hypothetical protein